MGRRTLLASRPGRGSVRLLAALALALVAVAAYAVEESVSVDVRWRVLPYQTLRLAGSSQDVTTVSYRLRPATPLERSRGYVEDENAFRFRVVSNTPWRLQVRWANAAQALAAVEVRQHGHDYAPVGAGPVVLASGPNGSFDVGVDVRVAVGETDIEAAEALLLCTIMPD